MLQFLKWFNLLLSLLILVSMQTWCCQGIPTTPTTTITTIIMPTADTTNNKQSSFPQDDDFVDNNNNEIKTTTAHNAFDATTPTTTILTTTTATSTTTYAKEVLSMNETIDVLLQEVRIFPTTTTLRVQQMLPTKTHTTPIITADIKASRIYESFRTTPDDDYVADTMTPTTTHRSKRYSVAAHMEATTYRSYTNSSSSSAVNTLSPSILRKRTASADMLSRNISIILENLLKSYEQSQLPTHGQGVPTVVRTNILIRSMGPVSELDMDYSMDCYFRQYWRDKRLSFQGPIKSLSLSIKMLDKIWRPDTYFYNGKHSHIHTITVPNKLLRLDQDGGILYSMRLTIKATCPMELKNFPMDRQSCPLIIGSYGYTNRQLVYEWKGEDNAVSFVPGMTLNQFDLISMMHRNNTYTRREGDFSVLHVAFNLKRHTGYFLIQVYVPCILIVVLSWVSFWIHREATSDRVGLCITAVLTLSTISLDSRTDLPKVKYATALDWFLLISFLYCIATLLEFAGVHYFTKLGSGEIPISEDEWEDIGEEMQEIEEEAAVESCSLKQSNESICELPQSVTGSFRKRNAMICPIYNDPMHIFQAPSSHASTMERTTQTEPPIISKSRQVWLCFIGDDKFRRQRERDAASVKGVRHVNSVSLIDRISRIAFPMSFAFFNLLYWLAYGMYKKEFSWSSVKG